MDTGNATSLERLNTPVQFVKGIGPRRAELLERLNLRAVKDLLFFFPRDYRDPLELKAIPQLQEGVPASVVGVVEEFELRNTGVGRCLLGVLIRDGSQYLRALWFNQPHMRDRFSQGLRVLLSGTPRLNGGRWEMTHPQVEVLNEQDQVPAGSILPVYGLTEGLRQFEMRRIVSSVLDAHADAVEETFPATFLTAHQLLPIQTALQQIHRPSDAAGLAQARRRFVYQELLVLQVALALRRQQLTTGCQSPALPLTAKIDARIRRLFPFELTPAQNQAIAEISQDMGRPAPMNRLLQGDVGSGKTVVAEYAMLLTVAHGHQAVIMAPTEVLARQHLRTLTRDLRDSRVRIALLTGSLTAGQRRETLVQIAAGQLDLIVGTHALLNEHIEFSKLGLVVIDEQHKFGVQQRAALRRSGLDPHYLVMTATPIPRTVSMTWYGDLDVSTLRESPPGRSVVHTYLGAPDQRAGWWDFFRKKVREGRQGYVIAPQIEAEDAAATLASVQQSFEALANGELEEFRLALLHGQLGAAEKDAVMQAFQRGETQVLVATSVVEVGVDVPNATLMTIEGGERFGLAQLHQLRGRISRGAHPGYLCVFAEPKTDEAHERLQAFSRTTDGFELAELDFRLRGPGDLFSARQHGWPPFRVADLTRDAAVLDETRRDAQQLVAEGAVFLGPEWVRLRRMVSHRYGQVLELADVG
jgi:ATP-dependent DNA helicase RecG